MTPFKFEIEISLHDFRGIDSLESENQKLCYKMLVKNDDQHCCYWSQDLKDEDVGTRQSYWNAMDYLRQKLLNRLCPDEATSTIKYP